MDVKKLKAGQSYVGRPDGWDEELTGAQLDDRDPYDGPTEEFSGVLEIKEYEQDTAEGPLRFTVYTLDGRAVDPKTLRSSE